MSLSKLTVRANPYAAFDHNGNLAGVVPCDAVDHVAYSDPKSNIRNKDRSWETRRYVGATVDQEKTIVREGRGDALPNGDQDTFWKFVDGDIELPNTPYYRSMIRTGCLVASNLETAKESGIEEKQYLAPELALEAAKVALAASWVTHYPEAQLPAWARNIAAPKDESKALPSNVKQLKKASA